MGRLVVGQAQRWQGDGRSRCVSSLSKTVRGPDTAHAAAVRTLQQTKNDQRVRHRFTATQKKIVLTSCTPLCSVSDNVSDLWGWNGICWMCRVSKSQSWNRKRHSCGWQFVGSDCHPQLLSTEKLFLTRLFYKTFFGFYNQSDILRQRHNT